MKKDPVKTAQEILKAFGGKENVISATHCATRLRVEVKDASIIDEEGMKEIQGVAGYFSKSGQHQVILGTGFVNKVCAEFQKLAGVTAGDAEVTENGEKEKLSFQSTTKMISDIFIPIIPVLLATGILMGVRSLLVNGFGIELSPSFDTVFSVLTDTAYTFIPVLVAWSACKKFGGSPILGIVLGLMLVSPTLPNKWDVVNGVADPLSFVFGPLHLNITGYQSSVIPALFMGFFAAKLEKKLHQVIPDILDMLLVPFLTLLVSLLAGLFVVGPVLSGIEKGMTDLILMMLKLPFGIGGIAYGGLIQILCSVGMQKNKQKRANMIPALIPALFGISEPVMYGLTFPRLKPFFMGCLGGAVGGGFAAIVGLCAKGTGASMIPGMLLYLQGGMIEYIIVLLLSVGVAFAGTWLIMKKNPEAV